MLGCGSGSLTVLFEIPDKFIAVMLHVADICVSFHVVIKEVNF